MEHWIAIYLLGFVNTAIGVYVSDKYGDSNKIDKKWKLLTLSLIIGSIWFILIPSSYVKNLIDDF